jgi:biopolymer transport protein ExbD
MDTTPMIDVTFQLLAFFMFVLNFSEVTKSNGSTFYSAN